MSFGAICRTRMLRAKAGVPMSVEKWWKKQRLAEGEVRFVYIYDYIFDLSLRIS